MKTIGSKLDETQGVGLGFDFLRIALAVGVVCWHGPGIAGGTYNVEEAPYIWILGYGILYAFFALSGFLIAASAMRLGLRDFLINRGLRIFPALFVEVILTAFVLGAIFTTLDLKSYFTNPLTYHYLTNLFGWMNYWLPGVFETNPITLLNISLWTVPFEMGCYAIMSGFIVFGLLKRPAIILAGLATFMAIGLVIKATGIPSSGLAHEASRLFTGRGSRLFVAFVIGILIYIVRYRIRYSPTLIVGAISICLFAAAFIRFDLGFPALSAVLAVPLAYLTVCAGISEIPLPGFLHKNDLSYGVYLYGMPIQQTMVYLFPWITDPVAQLCLSLPPIFLFAFISWNAIEKPITKLRKRFSFIARVRGADDDKPPTEFAAVRSPAGSRK
jgi:peptidoglycan/LPS O-acetylase OafA/YrhL